MVIEAFKTGCNILGAAIQNEQMNMALLESEASLAKTTQTLSAILNAATDSIVMINLDTTCLIINPAGAARLGRRADDIVGQPLCEIVAPEAAARRKAIVEHVIQTKQPILFEDEESENVWFEHSIYPVFDDSASVNRIAIVSRDISKRKQAEEALARTLAEKEVILDNSPVGIAFLTEQQQFIRVNNQLEKLFGYTEKELQGKTTEILYFSTKDYAKKQTFPKTERLMRHKNGTTFWCSVLVQAIEPEDLSKGYIWSLEDITEQRRVQENQRLAATVFETISEGVMITDANNDIIMVNPAFTHLTGYSFDEVVGKKPVVLISGHHNASFYKTMWKSLHETGKWQGEIRNRRKNGEFYVEWLSIVAVREANHNIVQYVAVFSDITKRKEAEELIWHQAHHDALTGLPNRTLFADRLLQAVHIAKKSQKKQLAVMFIDLDRFKWVNDTMGHEAGDLLLKEVALRLNACVRDTDTVARLGGDEFTVIMTQINHILDTQTIAKRILKSLSTPFMLKEQEVSIASSIGIASFPKDGLDAETLLKKADTAMYQAKNQGRNRFIFFDST